MLDKSNHFLYIEAMNHQEIEYDVFLSHVSEDSGWSENLAERLRSDGERVWFDKWELKPGDYLLQRLNDGLKKSQKMVAVWSQSYFRDDKVWTLAEGYSQQQPDVLAMNRPLIPLLIENCDILPTFPNILYLDFRNHDDNDLRFRQLIEALDLPRKEFAREEVEFREHEPDRAKIGKLAREKGKLFEDEVATFYQLLDFDVRKNIKIVQFAPNGKYLVAAGTVGRLQFWDFKKQETFLYRYHFGPGA